ncbi:MAG TPA: ArsA-related P-loop ATPase [Candidatus Lustribacter sp.]|nr:ArsA-related P-loop ATPase [Candidatus Lustribacter sp.]
MSTPSPTLPVRWATTRLHIVTGKGGTGKTTVAAALALALAAEGKRVLLAEVEGRQGISQVLDVAPLGLEETRLMGTLSGGEVVGLSVDAKAALLEYLQLFYKLGRAGGALERFGAIDFATTIAPGVRDVLLIGKIYEANGRPSGGRAKNRGGPRAYDAIVLDAPPTGRVVRFLSVSSEVAGLARVGPIKSQAESIMRMLTSRQTLVHLVTLLEDMPVQETIDTIRDLDAVGLPVGAVIVNQVREDVLAPEGLDALERLVADPGAVDREAVRASMTRAGIRVTGPMLDGLLREGADHAMRTRLAAEQWEVLAETGRPMLALPTLVDGVDANGVRELADWLGDLATAGAVR